jgi:predicted O-methyltransferase YrrM
MRRFIAKLPLIGPLALGVYRLAPAAKHLRVQAGHVARWLFRSRETTNFTYDLTDLNKRHLAWFVAHITGKPLAEITQYLHEIEADDTLRNHIAHRVRQSAQTHKADAVMPLGRRAGWYALVRALKPAVVVETGVEKGLGAVVIAAALLRNRQEGHPGTYYGTDIDPRAGFLFTPPYNAVGTILYGDSLQSLQKLDVAIDLFINDSDHSAEYEMREYETVWPKLAARAIVVGDNAHVTDKLPAFAQQHGKRFLFWREAPKNHWYPGSGIGVLFS